MRKPARLVALSCVVASAGLSGCAAVHAEQKVVNAGHTIEQTVEANKATIDSFTSTVKASEGATFEATYVTTGRSPSTIVYAVQPPKGLAFTDTPTRSNKGVGRVDVVANSTGEYLCRSSSGSDSVWSCQKAKAVDSTTETKLLDFYTPAHWVAFLKGFSLAAGFAGDKVTSSTKTVNGFAMQCVDFRATGVKGKSTICTTRQGVLGYVKVASDRTSFEITKYSATPAASLFRLPPGAKITNLQSRAP